MATLLTVRGWGIGLQVAGIVVQIIGALFIAAGSWRTWHEFADEGFWDWLALALAAKWQKLSDRLRTWGARAFGLRQDKVIGAGSTLSIASASDARARVGYGPLDASDVQTALGELERRTRVQVDQIADLQEREQDDIAAVRSELRAIADQLGVEVQELKARDQRVAVGAIRPTAFGLALTAIGLVLIGVGLVLAG